MIKDRRIAVYYQASAYMLEVIKEVGGNEVEFMSLAQSFLIDAFVTLVDPMLDDKAYDKMIGDLRQGIRSTRAKIAAEKTATVGASAGASAEAVGVKGEQKP